MVNPRVLVGFVLWQKCPVAYQYDWYWGSGSLYRISRLGTGTEGDYVLLVGLVLGQ